MPVHSFLASIADKAQSAISHLPAAAHRPNSPDSATQPTANESAGASYGGYKSHALESIQHQLRQFGQQYSSATPVQKIITTEKGVAIDFDSVSRDSKAQSKELYTWGQTETEDLKDVTDRLAYLNFVQGSLAGTLATKLDAARFPLKALRDAENALAPRRTQRANLQTQIVRLEHDQQRGGERKIAELRDQIRKAEQEDLQQEKEIELLKRKAIRESENAKWEAIREYGEKLVLLSQAAAPIIAALPSLPPTPTNPYTGAQATGAARASLQRALDNYKTGHINLTPLASDLDTRSFGESHASELSSIHSQSVPAFANVPGPGSHSPTIPVGITQPSHPASAEPAPIPAPAPAPIPPTAPPSSPGSTFSPLSSASAVNPAAVYPSSTPHPGYDRPHVHYGVPPAASPSVIPVAASSPPMAPISTPAPVTDDRQPSEQQHLAAGPSAAGKLDSAEEKKRPAGTPQAGPSNPSPPAPASTPKYESAEEEKRRLEREERERILRGETQQGSYPPDKKDKDDDLPPSYQEI
ncbi:hypothetical protein AX16_009624 [Volvariella volvacea WC 439]|nr:hypothetical protein AX16_009624 [Volvariella volvacea WC 439]